MDEVSIAAADSVRFAAVASCSKLDYRWARKRLPLYRGKRHDNVSECSFRRIRVPGHDRGTLYCGTPCLGSVVENHLLNKRVIPGGVSSIE